MRVFSTELPAAVPFSTGYGWRVVARWVGLAVAVFAAARAVVLLRAPDQPGLTESPLLWFLLAAGCFGAVTAREAAEAAWIQPISPPPIRPARRWLALAALGVGGTTMLAYALRLVPQPALVAGWLLAQPLWLAAFLPRCRRPKPPPLGVLAELFALIVLLAVGGVLRLWNNAWIPLEWSHDMASHGIQARALLAGDYKDFFGVGFAYLPLIGFWPTAFALLLFGDNMAGLNTFPALAGLASLVSVYMLGRELFGWRAALFATVLATGNLTHLGYSRAAEFMDPVPFVGWSLYFLVRGLRRGGLINFAGAGLLAAYALHTYHAGRIILPVAGAVLALVALAEPRALWQRRRGLAVAAVGLLLGLGPNLIFLARSPEIAQQRAAEVSVFGPGAWPHTAGKYNLPITDGVGIMAEQLRRSALFFWRYNDGAPMFPIERNMLDPISGALLIFALGYAAWRWRSLSLLLLLVWAIGYVLAGTLSLNPPSSMRMLGVTLPVSLLCGLALDRGLRLLPDGRRWAVLALGVGLLLGAVTVARNWQDYLSWAADPRAAGRRSQIVRFLLPQPPSYQILMVSREFQWSDRENVFLLRDRHGASIPPEALASGQISWPTEPTIFVLGPDERPLVGRLAERYPAGRLVDGSLPPLSGIFYAFYTDDFGYQCCRDLRQ